MGVEAWIGMAPYWFTIKRLKSTIPKTSPAKPHTKPEEHKAQRRDGAQEEKEIP